MEKTEFELFAYDFTDTIRSYRDRWVRFGKEHPEVSKETLRDGFLSEVMAYMNVVDG